MTTPEGKEGAGPNGQPPQSWVQFDEEDGNQQAPPARGDDSTPAVIDAQAVQVGSLCFFFRFYLLVY